MTMKLNNHTNAYEEAKNKYADVVKNQESTPEQVEAAWIDMQDALVESLTTQITNNVSTENMDKNILVNRGIDVLTSEERQFAQNALSTGFTDEIILPDTIEERVYEDLLSAHPLLNAINFRNLGTVTLTTITSEYDGAAVWGPIFGDIKGQLNAIFKQEKVSQSKLTAFVVLPKDLDIFGPEWLIAYMRTQISETFSIAIESAIVNGVGPVKEQPIGLTRDLAGAIDPTNGYAKKAAAGALTLADEKTIIKELAGIGRELSTAGNGKPLNISDKVILLINPQDAWDLKGDFTIQNGLGDYITKLPFNFTLVESIFVEAGEVVAFVRDRYDAYRAGGVEVREYRETLAMEDANLHVAKTHLFGKPRDNKVAAIYTLNVTP